MLLIIAETIFAVATIVLSPVPCMGLSALHCLRTDDGAPTSPVQEAPEASALRNFSLLFIPIFSLAEQKDEQLVKNIHILKRENEVS